MTSPSTPSAWHWPADARRGAIEGPLHVGIDLVQWRPEEEQEPRKLMEVVENAEHEIDRQPIGGGEIETMLAGAMSIWASAIARTSAGVKRPCLGCDWTNASSGLPNSRRPTASRGRSGASGSRMRIITLSASKRCPAISDSVPRVTRSSREPRFSQTYAVK